MKKASRHLEAGYYQSCNPAKVESDVTKSHFDDIFNSYPKSDYDKVLGACKACPPIHAFSLSVGEGYHKSLYWGLQSLSSQAFNGSQVI